MSFDPYPDFVAKTENGRSLIDVENNGKRDKRSDKALIEEMWARNGGFEELIQHLESGGEYDEYCVDHLLREGKILRYIKDDANRLSAYNEAVQINALKMQKKIVDIAVATEPTAMAIQKSRLVIEAVSAYAKRKAVGYYDSSALKVAALGSANLQSLPSIRVEFVSPLENNLEDDLIASDNSALDSKDD